MNEEWFASYPPALPVIQDGENRTARNGIKLSKIHESSYIKYLNLKTFLVTVLYPIIIKNHIFPIN